MDKPVIKTSVRTLVEFIFRGGDIDNRTGRGVQKEAMAAGSRMHRKIQKARGKEYQAEVSLKAELEREHYRLLLEGRADGLIVHENAAGPEITVDEIKCMYADVRRFESPQTVHLAQAKCYACIYALQNPCEKIRVQITYCSLETEEKKYFRETFSVSDLQIWFQKLLAEWDRWMNVQVAHVTEMRESARRLAFPFPWRPGQKRLAEDVYRTILRKKQLFIQAPTGTGKTISTVFPAVKALGEKLSDKIFYLTAKTVTGVVADETFDLLRRSGLKIRMIRLTAKEKLCPLEVMDCNPAACPYAKGHFDRVNDAVYAMITAEDVLTRERILDYARTYQVCPFEMGLDASYWADAIICDYNYVFDPNVFLRRFFGEGVSGNYLFLVDEAHNLVERGRDMYSAVLCKEDILALRRYLKTDRKISKVLTACNRQMLEWKRSCEKYQTLDSLDTFSFSLLRLASLLDEKLQERTEFEGREEMLEFYLQLRHFLNMLELRDENYVIYTDFGADGRFLLHLYCVNPSVNLQRCLDHARSTVFFSATLLPIRYYRNLLSGRQDDYAVYARSVFLKEQSRLLIAPDVTTLYKRRNPQEYKKIADYIYKIIQGKTGNYLIFFPSYHLLDEVAACFSEKNRGNEITCLFQRSGMDEKSREAFIAAFSEPGDRSLAGFCVLGGIFSEGIDLREEKLIGTIIVGTGLPQICTEREILRAYYDRKNHQGFAYAYLYPGMNKVLQAAGRLIRTENDRGIIALLDERFLRNEYRSLFPREWDRPLVCCGEELPREIRKFWEE